MQYLGVFVTLFMCSYAFAQATTRPADAEFVISPTRLQQTKPATFFYRELEASFANFNDVARPVHQALRAAVREGGNRVAGPEMMVYFGLPADRETIFKFQFGVIVEDGAKPQGDFKVRELPAMECRTILYSGHVKNISRAFRRVMEAVSSAGEQMTDEIRELSLHWEGEESDNNVVMIQVGLRK